MIDTMDPDYADLTMEALAEIFEANGILVTQKCEISDLFKQPRIIIRGDEVIAFHAAEIALQHGYPLCSLACVYDVRGTPENQEKHVNLASRRWRLKFRMRFV